MLPNDLHGSLVPSSPAFDASSKGAVFASTPAAPWHPLQPPYEKRLRAALGQLARGLSALHDADKCTAT